MGDEGNVQRDLMTNSHSIISYTTALMSTCCLLIACQGHPLPAWLKPDSGTRGDQSTCENGLHDGGDGTCVSVYTCSSGFHNDGTGICMVNAECPEDRLPSSRRLEGAVLRA